MGQAKIIHKRVTYINVFFNSFERDKKNHRKILLWFFLVWHLHSCGTRVLIVLWYFFSQYLFFSLLLTTSSKICLTLAETDTKLTSGGLLPRETDWDHRKDYIQLYGIALGPLIGWCQRNTKLVLASSHTIGKLEEKGGKSVVIHALIGSIGLELNRMRWHDLPCQITVFKFYTRRKNNFGRNISDILL